ncbi:MAG: hypothetical protein WD969_10255 [Paracoccaceae bacterium]
MKVLIASPTTQGIVTTAYAHTLTAATAVLNEVGALYRLMLIDGADVVMARTILAHAFMADESLTHILFIDSDMAVDGAALRRLIALKAPIVGVAYAERRIDLDAYAARVAEGASPDAAKALSSAFTLRMRPGRKEVNQGLVEVEGFGFGCVLIAKEVFSAMVARGIAKPMTSAKLRASGLKGDIHDFFAPIRQPDGDALSEDYAFCERVRALGDVPLLAYIGPGIGHVGQFTYGGAYIERLRAGKI